MNWRTADLRSFTYDPKTGKTTVDHGEHLRYRDDPEPDHDKWVDDREDESEDEDEGDE
jgi:hypothetical protein